MSHHHWEKHVSKALHPGAGDDEGEVGGEHDAEAGAARSHAAHVGDDVGVPA